MSSSQSVFTNGEGSSKQGYREHLQSRVYVNRPVNLNKIKHYGFDMDYTLALYKWPVYHEALYLHALDAFVSLGYPKELANLKYDIDFPVRGLWFDTLYGCFLKVDSIGHILTCVLGYQQKTKKEIEEMYQGGFVTLTDRMYIFNTPFNIPELMFFGAVINYYVEADQLKNRSSRTGVFVSDGQFKQFNELFKDMRQAIEVVHEQGKFKSHILKHVADFVEKDPKIPAMLKTLRENEKDVFLVTNSDWEYTNGIMTHLLDENWCSAFDLIVTDGRKPRFFAEGTNLYEIDIKTGEKTALFNEETKGAMKRHGVYSGGNVDQLEDALEIKDKSVLYIGDHIFGDILKSKKKRGWKTFLVVEELDHQVACWVKCKPLINQLEHVDLVGGKAYNSCSVPNGDVNMSEADLRKSLKEKIKAVDRTYGKLGGLFTSGSRETFFASQVKRYADIYATVCTHLMHYPLDHQFTAARQRLPHEMLCDEIPEDAPLKDSFDTEHREKNRMTNQQAAAMLAHLPNISSSDWSN